MSKYTEQYKQAVIHRYENGEPLKELSRELHVGLSTLYRWRTAYCSIQTKTRTYTPKEFDSLRRNCDKLRHELEIIRLCGFLSDIPLRKRLEKLESIYTQKIYSVYELCEALQVDRGTFYNHVFRRADRTKREEEQTRLMMLVQQVFDDNAQRYGAEKIRVILAKNGVHVSAKRISAIMRELGLQSVRTDGKKQYVARQRSEKRNLLQREFSAEHPNQVWVSDFTYFKLNRYWVYICVIIDLYSRKIVGWKVSRNASTNMVTSAFRNAFAARNCPLDLTFHSDRGGQYDSKTFSTLLHKCGVKRSFSRPGNPLDNAVAESFFASFKKEEAYRREYASEASFQKSVANYIEFYNCKRPHQTLLYKTPEEAEAAYKASV